MLRLLPGFMLLFLTAIAVAADPEPPPPLTEAPRDELNVWMNVPEYAFAKEVGARVLNFDNPKTFIVLWTPPDFAKQEIRRTLVCVPDYRTTAYADLKAELASASKNHYALLVLEWWVAEQEYLGPRTIYDLADRGLKYMEGKYHVPPRAAAMLATGRGATYAYEVAYWDRKLNTNYFPLFICHNGGVPTTNPSVMMRRIRDGDLGDEPFAGAHFFLYGAAAIDPHLPATLNNAKAIVEDSGAKVDRLVLDDAAKPRPFRATPAHEAAIQLFLNLTPATATTQPASD